MTTQKSPSGGRGRKTFNLTIHYSFEIKAEGDWIYLTGLDPQWFRPGNAFVLQPPEAEGTGAEGGPPPNSTMPVGLGIGGMMCGSNGTLSIWITNSTGALATWFDGLYRCTVLYERDDT